MTSLSSRPAGALSSSRRPPPRREVARNLSSCREREQEDVLDPRLLPSSHRPLGAVLGLPKQLERVAELQRHIEFENHAASIQ